MDYSKRIEKPDMAVAKWLCIPACAFSSACDSSIAQEVKQAESDGKIINNDIMLRMYPQSFRPGNTQYIEMDFEAGADFIRDEIKLKYDRNICSEPQINWRR